MHNFAYILQNQGIFSENIYIGDDGATRDIHKAVLLLNYQQLRKDGMAAYLQLENIKKEYNISRTETQKVLRDISVEFKQGELVALLGRAARASRRSSIF